VPLPRLWGGPRAGRPLRRRGAPYAPLLRAVYHHHRPPPGEVQRREGAAPPGMATPRPVRGPLAPAHPQVAGGPRKGNPKETQMDVILAGGQVVDGSGAPADPADVGVEGGRIGATGE